MYICNILGKIIKITTYLPKVDVYECINIYIKSTEISNVVWREKKCYVTVCTHKYYYVLYLCLAIIRTHPFGGLG